MKRYLIIWSIGMLLGAAVGVSAATPLFVDATPADNFKVYWLVKAKEAPKIDGKLDDAIWQQAEPLTDWGITDYGRQKGALGEIDFRAAWDDKYLYVGARMYHRRNPKDMDEFRRQVSNVSTAIYGRECLEIHIDGNHDHATRFQSIINALNERMMIWYYDFGWGILTNNDYGLDADWDTAAAIEKDCWTLEVRYALADIQVKPKVGYSFGLNPCWFNWADTRDDAPGYWWQFLTWSTHGNSHHDPRLYGHFILVNEKPKTLVDGLRLAYPDLDKRTLMIQTADGYLVFRNGEQHMEAYDVRVKSELADALALAKRVEDLFATGKAVRTDYLKKSCADLSGKLKQISTDITEKGSTLKQTQLQAYRKDIADIAGQLDNYYWRVQEDVMLSGLPAVGK